MAYDKGYAPPDWWLARLDVAMGALGYDDGDLAREARDIDGRSKKWGSDRISKMRTEKKGTFPLVSAVSSAVNIPSPVVEALDEKEAEALQAWIVSYRRKNAADSSKVKSVLQRLNTVVESAEDQTEHVPSTDEGNPRDPRTRRAPGRR